MVDAGGPGSVRKCPWVALADLGHVEGFDRSGEEDQLYAFSCLMGSTKEKCHNCCHHWPITHFKGGRVLPYRMMTPNPSLEKKEKLTAFSMWLR